MAKTSTTYFSQESYENVCESLLTYLPAFQVPNKEGLLLYNLGYLNYLSNTQAFKNCFSDNYDRIARNIEKDLKNILNCIDSIIKAFDETAERISNASNLAGNNFKKMAFAGANLLTSKTVVDIAQKRFDSIGSVSDGITAQRKMQYGSELSQAKDEYNTLISKYSDEDLANMIISGGLNISGNERKKALGNRYDAVQKIINQKMSSNSGGSNGTTTIKKTATTSKISNTGTKQTSNGTSSKLEKQLKKTEDKQKTQKDANEQKKIVDQEKKKDEEQKIIENQEKKKTEEQKIIENQEKKKAEEQKIEADKQRKIAEEQKAENEKLRKELEEQKNKENIIPSPEPSKTTSESQPQPSPQPASSEIKPQAEPRTYTQNTNTRQYTETQPSVEATPSEQTPVEEVKPTPEVTPSTKSSEDTETSLPNPNIDKIDSGSRSSSSSKGTSVVPIAVGLGAAVAGGIGIKAIHDHRKNSKFDDQNEDSVTNGNRFWTEEDPNVIHTEQDLFNDESASDSENVSYQAVENNTDNSDTWNIEESEISDDNTFDLLSENN